LPEDLKDLAELNEALPIGYGQTISQPLVVAFMLELLQPKEGEKILDIGSGSGWTSALLAEIVGEKGKVIANGNSSRIG
jgi:protein-L-isoaspartate(D-aspartate) O-methyltransferase